MQLLALAVVEKLPAAHASQTRSLVAEGACATKVPAAQLWNAAHESAFVVALKLPSLQAVQAPAAQNFPAAQARPSGALLPLSTQTLVPVAHEVLPTWQALADGAHATFALHAWHAPALQTRSTPQLLPSPTLAPASLQTGAPEAQSVLPWWHGFAAKAHGASC